MDKLSYAWGLAMGRQLQGMGMKELNVVDFKDGVRSVFDGSEPAIGVEEAQKLIQDYLNDLQAKAEEQKECRCQGDCIGPSVCS